MINLINLFYVLVDIWTYSFDNWGTDQADKYLDQIDEVLQLLATNPLMGIN
ncbi:MAG: type II toxin-antitoxin system RelE/ParE family toxin [Alteromonadaceae bacterium]|nr:type II toxin-antitoxin system RelE/ParE family toxin [Alteromonadaceae bacterium]MBL4910795.1 type II toxin-antitoxin system RelE/ParE family toxin [Alteromonadaceae bacterium]